MTHTVSESKLAREIAQEQAHVDRVYAELAKAAKSARRAAKQGRAMYRSDRQTWMRDEDGTAMFERDAFTFQAAKRLAVLDAEHEGLVFGRLDQTDGEIRYIGRIGVRDAEYEPLVIDWRAKAAEPFYRATANDPMDVVRRRVLRCRNDKVVGIEDDLLDSTEPSELVIIGEGALMAALSRARGPRMRDIVATIQSEQDEAIRAPYQGVTVISGGPGTGKTVVALHRAAYLLYSNRRRFERGGILVVGPSPVFMNYIERVLPSLGEDSVSLAATGQIVNDVLDVRCDREDTAAEAALKGTLRMVPVLKALVALAPAPVDVLRASVKGEVMTLRHEQLAAIRADVLARHKYHGGRASAESALVAALMAQLTDDVELEPEEIADQITSGGAFRSFLDAWWPSEIGAPDLLRRLADPEVVARVAASLTVAERDTLAASFQREGWSVGDAALLDELVSQLGQPPEAAEPGGDLFIEGDSYSELVTTADTFTRRIEHDPHAEPHRTYAHLLVDEAQDITPMQWRMLRRRGSQASWTIVGDPAQSSWPDVAENTRAITELIGTNVHRSFRLSTNYRSPKEVFDLAGQIIRRAYPSADLPHAVRSTGVEPVLASTPEATLHAGIEQQLAILGTQVEGSIGLIVPPSRLASVQAALENTDLPEGLRLRLSLLTPLAVKGLEYDATLVVAPDEIVTESPGGERVLYVALTRPTQRLVTLDIEGSTLAWRTGLHLPGNAS
ncbi:MAG: UvrD-helicase domain-containing protein [Propionibacteriaceae bacterium]|nr:AAA family ATPase [Micropruina sp.]HBX80295.1 helicase [Propionibacteriaceae bacterium]HBY22519.1 helicase [Propionibacteriaceae bacterium]